MATHKYEGINLQHACDGHPKRWLCYRSVPVVECFRPATVVGPVLMLGFAYGTFQTGQMEKIMTLIKDYCDAEQPGHRTSMFQPVCVNVVGVYSSMPHNAHTVQPLELRRHMVGCSGPVPGPSFWRRKTHHPLSHTGHWL